MELSRWSSKDRKNRAPASEANTVKSFVGLDQHQWQQVIQNGEIFQCTVMVVCVFSLSSSPEKNCFCWSNETTLELFTNSCKTALLSLRSSSHVLFWVLFWVRSKRQNRLLPLPEDFSDRFGCYCFWREQKPQIAYLLFSGQKLIFGAMWVGFEELLGFYFEAFGKKTLDFEILFSYVLGWENWPPASPQSTLSTFIFN